MPDWIRMTTAQRETASIKMACLGWSVLLASLAEVRAAEPLAGATAQEARFVEPGDPLLQSRVLKHLDLRSADIQMLTLRKESAPTVTVAVSVNDKSWTFVLEEHSIRGERFQVLVEADDGSGVLRSVPAPPSRTYRGTVAELPGSKVRASIDGTSLYAVLFTPEGVYGIEPVRVPGLRSHERAHVVYRLSDWLNSDGATCGNGAGAPFMPAAFLDQQAAAIATQGAAAAAGTTLRVADLALDSDRDFYVKNGSSIDATVLDMENIINAVEAIYEAPEIGISYEITTVIVRTNTGAPYTSNDAETLLNQFRSTWQSTPESLIRRDTAHLFTGKNLDGSTIGIAYLGVLCNSSFGFGLSESRFTTNMTARVGLTAHELGHNWNAPHCNGCTSCTNCCRIMCSGLGGCTGILTSFGCESITDIVNHKNSRSCLADVPAPLTLPFFDDFPSGTLDPAKWTFNDGAQVGSTAVNEPSPPFSVQLNANSAQEYEDDDLRSNVMLLSGQDSVRLAYAYQHRGVEAGERLIVEYFADSRQWIQFAAHTSDGIDMNDFAQESSLLPASAYHDEFRVRFRAEVDESNDTWFIDDVAVTSDCNDSVECDDGLFCTGAETCVDNACAAGTNPCPGGLCSEALNACVACLVDADCGDGLFCNGIERCNAAAGTCLPGDGDPCAGTNRPFCDELADACAQCQVDDDCTDDQFCNGTEHCGGLDCVSSGDPCAPLGLGCNEFEDECSPPPLMTVELSSPSVAPGGSVTARVFLQDANDVTSYRAGLSISPVSGGGQALLPCPDGASIDTSRPDYIFAGLSGIAIPNCQAATVEGGLFSGFAFVSTPEYLGEFKVQVTPDAPSGAQFTIGLQPPPTSFYRDIQLEEGTLFLGGAQTVTVVEAICNPPTVSPVGSRAIQVTPAENASTQALRVTSPVLTCLDKWIQPDGSLSDAPAFLTAAEWGTVTAQGLDLVPSTLYEITADCGAAASSPAPVATHAWGEVNGVGGVDVDDILCVLAIFGGDTSQCPLPAGDVAPCTPNGIVDVDDILGMLNGFASQPFPCSPPCP